MPNRPAVSLRARTDGDVDALYRIAADLPTWEERNPSTPTTLTRAEYERRLENADSGAGGRSVAFVIDVDGACVGTVSLFGFDDLARHAELGIALLPDARGKGIGTAAVTQIVEFGFVRCNLRRIHLEAIASNRGGLRAYEKCGFVIEGRRREHAWVRGGYEDMVLMGLLRSDWEQLPPE